MKESCLQNNQRGFVSIMFVVIMMTVITLTVVSFTTNSRKEQRQSLDRQLSTQAFLAAETGINYARKVITDELNANPAADVNQPGCFNTSIPANAYKSLPAKISDQAEISCLLVSLSPSTLEYDLDPSRQAKIIPIKPDGSITHLRFSWGPDGGGGALSGCGTDLKPVGSWTCPYGVLRADLTKTDGTVNRPSLAQNTYAGVFMPTTTGGTTSFAGTNAFTNFSGGASQGLRPAARCNSTECYITMSLPTGEYFLRIGTLYKATKLRITALNGTTHVPLKDAQIMIDATGKSQDVLRRLQVRTPLNGDSGNVHADYGLQTRDSICKGFTAYYNPTDTGYKNTVGC